ncbi:MAG: flagellar hook-basal body protein [Firmicutes bacterium]|nr:flagellar hook-basal body protein [Bacillota bacterium]
MFQGFYNLTSGMLTQSRRLNVISNNMVNVTTPGYKSDTFTQRTFHDEMMYRTGNMGKREEEALGSLTWKTVPGGNVTDYSEGGFSLTESPLDVCIIGSGFFQIDTGEEMVYTRNGSFSLDDEGYLTLSGAGRVQGEMGDILLMTDKIAIDADGSIVDENTGQYLGRISLVDFADYQTDLEKAAGNVFTANGQPLPSQASLKQKALEDSNVEVISEMTEMITSQRSLQSAAQVLQMYDKLAAKIVEIGPA